ncbi:hypothetical protein D7V68_14175 [Acinetobacter cumulans]|uniref:phage antirepressor N-terminal domain-containing protein n=1 Tax=Acinetobacter cumulans TaxID=2136182 RepID=UPI000EA4042A|nr:phage antirepressor N-terminal domain-containing protein [Acinetobacter cumulans]RKG46442.1 hypothetical protein D7V68_14175 [Acinetobacter cumulans]
MREQYLHSFNEMTVPFYEAQLSIVSFEGKPYIPMRPIVESIGLDWKSQHSKIKDRFSACVVEITIQLLGDTQNREHTCLPLNKLFGWLMTISPNKVKPEIREKVIRYQKECDDVLSNYWIAKLQRTKRDSDEFNQIFYIDQCSKQRGSISSYGMHDRKREKKIIKKLLQAWLAKQLNFDFINNDMEDK